MKRFILAVCVVLVCIGGLMIVSGRLSGDKSTVDKQGTAETPAGTVVSTGAGASGDAVMATEQPLISNEEAFSMAEDIIKTMSLEEKVGQMFLVHLSQLDDARTEDGNQYRLTHRMAGMIRDYHIGGIYLTQNNIGNQKQAKKLTSALQESCTGSALYIAAEEEGGGEFSLSAQVADLKDTGYTTQSEMGRNMSRKQVAHVGQTIAGELTGIGVNLNLAPVADVASDNNPDYALRCFGTEPDHVSSLVAGLVDGMRDGGMAVTLKYFPGMGNVPGEYTETVLEDQDSLMTLRNHNFASYAAGIEAGADCVMMSNISVRKITVKKLPAFMSQDIVTSLLREELDFNGVIMTPPLNDNVIIQNYTPGFVVTEAVKAGCDMILMPEDFEAGYKALLSAVQSGRIDEKVINTSVRRILQNKIQRGILVLEQ
ncbi:MAG: hypothetical protein J1F02_02420 [Lachnospiraceae bacterium]|nr:hypothetical protein [Lachnospiraceae bacterium]